WACDDHPAWRVAEAGPATPGRGRNIGFEAATTEWVALTDAGIELDAHWLDRLARVAEADREAEIVYGHYEPAPNGYFAACAALAYVAPPEASAHGPVRWRSIASSLVQKELWARAGGFPDLRAAEDRFFMRKLDYLGARVAIAPEARVTWQLQAGLLATFRRFRTYSRVNALAGEQRNWHHGVARMYAVALALGILAPRWRHRLLLGLLAGLTRVERCIWAHRQGRGSAWALNPGRIAGVAAVLLAVDAATFVGWGDAVLARRRGE
ncbi:MAG: glycosyltransferase family 2 protein, partial [Actinobacteria bacterium]|nr:glycosyltransferase family 2 protein [Actinomycetota bacterium]